MNTVSREALQYAASHFSDPEDARFMLQQFEKNRGSIPPSIAAQAKAAPVTPEVPTQAIGDLDISGAIVGAAPRGGGTIWARPLSNQDMIAGAFKDNWGRKVIKTPGIKQAMNVIDPAALVSGTATDPVNQVGRGLLLRNRTLDVGDSGTQAGLSLLQEKKFPFAVDAEAK